MAVPILSDVVIILGLSVLIILLFQRLKLPAILGFLLAGIIVGPYGLNLVEAVEEVELLSEIGIIFLLFVIGIEFSLKGLSSIRKTVLFGGFFQVSLTIAGVVSLHSWLGLTYQEAIFMGFLLSLSSTAIVLKMLQEQGELNSPHGRVSTAILIFQDLIVVVMMLLTPILAGTSDNVMGEIMSLLFKMIFTVLAIYLLSRYIVPTLLRWVVHTKNRELFILTTVVLCFATAWLTSTMGLSVALGAFFAGLVISESDYSHQATANILPFREIFISFFFVSVGMLLDISFFIDHLLYILSFALGLIIFKALLISIAVYLLRYSARTVLLTALSLFQVGEFSFLLSTGGIDHGLLSEINYQYFLSISIISMGITPFVIKSSPSIVHYLLRTPLPGAVKKRLRSISRIQREEYSEMKEILKDHLVVIGFGVNGQNVAQAAANAGIPLSIVELDPAMIKIARDLGFHVVYGDAGDEHILRHVHVHDARVVVIAISSNESTMRIVKGVRSFTERAFIIVRTRYVREMEAIINLGADEVIPEEFETSIEIFTRVLKKYLVPWDEILSFINFIRSRNYEVLRNIPALSKKMDDSEIHIPNMEIATIQVQQGKNKIVGQSLEHSKLRSRFGVTVLAIRRHKKYITEVHPSEKILQDDVLYLFGKPDSIIELSRSFSL